MLHVWMLVAALSAQIPWDLEKLSVSPRSYPAAITEEGVTGVFLEGLPWKGKPTRFFAWYGVPKGGKVPGMVLVHGGGGTAFAEWVRMWNARGYAAIAMDTTGSVPGKPVKSPMNLERTRHEHGGPDGWGGYNQVDDPYEDQWPYHAVADVILAHSFLRSLPGVDKGAIGLTGISWGGYLTNITGSVDARFRFAVPVYGCGFLGEDSAWLKIFEQMGPERRQRWLSKWDPSVYLPMARIPFLFVNGTNDFAYPMGSWQKSTTLPKGSVARCLRVAMKHNHLDGARPAEIFAFADQQNGRGKPSPRIDKEEFDAGVLRVRFSSPAPVKETVLNCTQDSGKWQERKWSSEAVAAKKGRLEVRIPQNATACFVHIQDDRGLLASTKYVTR